MVYIHGGGYVIGTAITYPSDFLALQGVVVVIIQYRLGPFGFLTTGDSAAPDNYGMLDQVEALKWINENIMNFGGNPNKVTIFGESADGSSVSLHLLSPLSRDLFHQAIAESGVDLSSFAVQPTSVGLPVARELAQKLNCGASDHNTMVSCIHNKRASDIQKASESIKFEFSNYLYWAPVVDKYFLLNTPQSLRKKKDFKQVPLIIAFASHEGATSLVDMVNNSFGLMESLDNGVSPTNYNGLFKMLLATFFIFCACWLHVRAEIVSTKYGDIEGLVTLYPNASGPFKSVSKFLGVPFSAPPTGELRFKAPQPPREWKPKVYSAKTHGSVCLQFKLSENVIKPFTSNFTFSEDCL
ncbi:unnamed protein product [Porites lobata]|uniref:Carboxylesterase type B domain-containing protein n=1 Tax=Porites lobata TaxID=104759 RepID=A0ABN8P1D6_9CNID|nr:unnamed protein product [Porites lobata]